MSGSVNKVIIIGNLCADVDVRTFQNGGKVANLRVATNETWKDLNYPVTRREGTNTVAVVPTPT